MKIEHKIMLFKAKELLPIYTEIDEASNYWQNYAKNDIKIYTIPGNHETILMEPHVEVLAKQLHTIFKVMQEEFSYEN